MNHIISKIEIDSFRSIQKCIIDTGNVNIFSGLNDVGKSNVLKALNLFFNSQTDFATKLNFYTDYSKVSLASAQQSAKKKQQIKIKIYFKAPSTFKSLQNKELWIEKVFDRLGNQTEHSSLDTTKQKSSLTRLLNNIKYFYIPALKGTDVLQYILGEVGKQKLIPEKDIIDLNQKVNSNIIDLAEILIKSSINTETKFELPVLVEDFWQKLNINTKYDEFDKLSEGTKKEKMETLKEEFYQIPLQLRGEGIKSKYIPPLLQWIQDREPNRQYIWGIDEPENSLEFKKAQEVANLYLGTYSKKTQLFLTSHSLAFIFPDSTHENVNIFRCFKGALGSTQVELLKNLFKEQEKYNLAEEVGALEIQKEVIQEWRIKDEQIKELKTKIDSLTKPVIFVEGLIDEAYFKRALENCGKAGNYPAEVKWIGHKDQNDQDTFTGNSSLDKTKSFLSAHNPPQKVILFYDVECKKEITSKDNLTVYCPKEIEGAKYKEGSEHLLVVPKDFDISKEEYILTDKKSTTFPKKSINKKSLQGHIFSLSNNQQNQWLANINNILEEIKNNYLS